MNLDWNDKVVRRRAIIVLVLLLLYGIYHMLTKSHGLVIPLPVVEVQTPKYQQVTEYIKQTGTTVAFNSVNLVARIEGFLDTIDFKDGSYVKKDKQLFVIQPEPYWEQLVAARAGVAAAKADVEYSRSEYNRQKRMYKDNATSLNNVEKWMAKTKESEANLEKAVADEQIAAINYSYTHIAAPFDGRIGRHLVDVGNLVGHGQATNLATIEQIDKLYVYFNLNEIDLLKLRAFVREKKITASQIYEISADISLQNETGFRHSAKLNFVNTGLNASTGTMEMRALLENKDYFFVPGLFVEVRVPVTQPQKQLTIPDSAVLYDQIGAYLLTLDAENTVLLTRVTLGAMNEGVRAITKGLKAEDRVIILGLQNASPGNKVTVRTTNS